MSVRLIVIGPLPPPLHGVTVSTGLVLASQELARRFAVEHLDTSDHRTSTNTGRWDPRNIFIALASAAALLRRLRGARGVVYLPLSQSTAALVRDCLFVQLAALARWKVALHLRGGEFKDVYRAQGRVMRRLLRSSLAKADSVAVLGSSLRWLFEGLVPAQRIAVVPNGTPEPESNGATRDPDTALFLSNLRRRKGVVQAVEAARMVVLEHPAARFVFVGGWEDEQLESEVRREVRGLEDRIVFRPSAVGKDHGQALASASFMLFPPVEPEGHPRVVLEAMAAGLPVVTTDRGAIRETVVDGECGFVLPDPEPRELADKMLELLRNPARRERMSRSARERYLERFTQAAADRALASWLEDVARAPARDG
ncbi:MAG TPA: glycosyltransferase family 4 protein [Thermoleophilaceae bacterium]|nr:glycosyltransferase family 4 protein [Thermoleophilaceae bacterium]